MCPLPRLTLRYHFQPELRELAGDDGVLAVPASSLASQLLQVYWVFPGFVSGGDHLVGAGLPAKTVCQAREMLDVPASSLASQLLQVYWCCRDLCLVLITL
jgi:hypothetical protein